MDLEKDFFLTLFLLGMSMMLLLIPVQGVDKTTSIKIAGHSYQVKLVSNKTLDGVNVGSHDMITNEIKLATGHGVWNFMSTCSHEVKHLKYDLQDKQRENPLTTKEEHKRMQGVNDPFFPWNWETECLALLPERFSYL